jgi:hypothetical protein
VWAGLVKCRAQALLPLVSLEPGASRPASESAVPLIAGLYRFDASNPRATPGCGATQQGMAQNLERQH